ncbi:hypothetical protein, partial [Micromonospora sp. NPDC005652]
MSNDVTTPDGGAPMAPPPRTSRRRALWVATGVAGLTGVVGLAALGGLAARDDRSGTEPVADNHAAAPQNAGNDSDSGKRDEGHGKDEHGKDGKDRGQEGHDRGEWGPDKGDWGKDGKDGHGEVREVACDDDALIDALELANRDHGGSLKLAENCTYELGVKDRKAGSALPEIKQDVTIKGNGSTIKRDAEDTFRIFRVADGGDLTLKDLTIKGGNANEFKYPGPSAPKAAELDAKRVEGDGGALLVERGGSAHLHGVKLADNSAEGDGGALANYGRTWLMDSKVVDNHAQGDGGGIYNEGILKVETTHVDDNTAGGNGGGVANGSGAHHDGPVDLASAAKADKGEHGRQHAGTVEIIGAYEGKDATPSTLSRNRAGHNGGALFSSGGWVSVSFTAITGNTACDNGGGVYAESTDLDLERVLVAGNHADGNGGGVVTTGGRDWTPTGAEKADGEASATISDSKIVDNTANRFGGGIYNGEWLIKIED